MTKVLLFGTHPKQFNGYSKVIYELAKCMSKMEDIDLTIYGFQNFYDNKKHRPDLPSNVKIYDAFANENPKSKGFGQNEVQDFVKLNDPDVCIVYNDMVVMTSIVTELKKIPDARFKIIGYIDQVYLSQKKMFIDFINKNLDLSILFTPHWEKVIKELGVTTPTAFLPHGFNKNQYYPVPKEIARRYFNLNSDDFIILNLNRNQPRKRWDICLKAMAEIVSRYPDEPIKMMIGTALQGEWNLLEMFERELNKRSLTLGDGMKHIIIMDNPQKVTDEETNLLYNVADIGINTCDGEGFGLCNFEQAGLGIPQIVPRLGGFIDFFDDECCALQDPQMAYYVGSSRDSVGGEALLISYMDVVDAIETYYNDKDIRIRHGVLARKRITENYRWDDIAKKLQKIIKDTVRYGEDDTKSLMEQIDKTDSKEEGEGKGEGEGEGETDRLDDATMDRLHSPRKKEEEVSVDNSKNSEVSIDNSKHHSKDVPGKKKVTKRDVIALQKQISEMLQMIGDEDE